MCGDLGFSLLFFWSVSCRCPCMDVTPPHVGDFTCIKGDEQWSVLAVVQIMSFSLNIVGHGFVHFGSFSLWTRSQCFLNQAKKAGQVVVFVARLFFFFFGRLIRGSLPSSFPIGFQNISLSNIILKFFRIYRKEENYKI